MRIKKILIISISLLIIFISTSCQKQNLNYYNEKVEESNTISIKKSVEEYEKEGIIFNEDKTTLIKYPQEIEYKEFEVPDFVTAIDEYAFFMNDYIQSITIPSSVISIKKNSFINCNNLNYITVDQKNENFVSVDGILFTKDMSTLISYPSNKSGDKYTVPDSVTKILGNAFSANKNIKILNLPPNLLPINPDEEKYNKFFRNMFTSLEEINIHPDNNTYTTIDGVLYSKDISTLICYPNNKKSDIFIMPNKVIKILADAFSKNNYLKSITLSENIEYIHDYNLQNFANLEEINISDKNSNFESIDGILFSKGLGTLFYYPDNKKGELYTIPESTVIIENYAFSTNKYLKSVVLPYGLQDIKYSAFEDSNIEEINIPDNNINIYQFAFRKCKKLNNVKTSKKTIDRIINENIYNNAFTETPFIENELTRRFIADGSKEKLEKYSIVKPYDTTIKYNTNHSANTANGGSIVADNEFIYYTKNGLNRIDKHGKNSEQILCFEVSNLFLYNDEIYYYGKDGFNNDSERGIYKLDKNTLKTELIINTALCEFIVLNDCVYFTDTNETGKILSYYNLTTSEKNIVDKNLENNRDNDALINNNDKIYYVTREGDVQNLIQYDVKTSDKKVISSSVSWEVFDLNYSKKQIYNHILYANNGKTIIKMSLENNNSWEEVFPRLDDNGYVVTQCVTDNYIFFFTNYFSLNYIYHDFHIFRIKHDGSEITNIYNSKQHMTDAGSTGLFARMYIVEDKIFFGDKVLDFDGNVLDWDM